MKFCTRCGGAFRTMEATNYAGPFCFCGCDTSSACSVNPGHDMVSQALEQSQARVKKLERTVIDMENATACIPEDLSVAEYVGQITAERDTLRAVVEQVREWADKWWEALDSNPVSELDAILAAALSESPEPLFSVRGWIDAEDVEENGPWADYQLNVAEVPADTDIPVRVIGWKEKS